MGSISKGSCILTIDPEFPRIAITGCSSGGKSSLIRALAALGYHTVEEPGRQIVREALAGDGRALPWVDAEAFAARAVEIAAASYEAVADIAAPVFFDRTLIDAIAHLERHALPVPGWMRAAEARCRYSETVFFAPPWREIYVQDAERPLPFETAKAEADYLRIAYRARGYRLIDLPKCPISQRAAFITGRAAPGAST